MTPGTSCRKWGKGFGYQVLCPLSGSQSSSQGAPDSPRTWGWGRRGRKGWWAKWELSHAHETFSALLSTLEPGSMLAPLSPPCPTWANCPPSRATLGPNFPHRKQGFFFPRGSSSYFPAARMWSAIQRKEVLMEIILEASTLSG